ncbi:MAG: hypothetical protein ACRD68_15280, partial [Pyrinomonadaceae bacterium]
MRIEISTEIPAPAAREAVACFVFKDRAGLSGAKGELLAAVERCVAEDDFKADEETSLFVHDAGREGGVRRLLLVGVGERGDD